MLLPELYQPTDTTMQQIDDVIDPMPPLCPLSVVTRRKQNDIDSDQNESLLKQQDSLGMTPLHILACSTKGAKRDIDLYRFIVASCPDSLIIEDKWGCLPVLYAIWGDAPQEIELFLIDKQKSTFPDHVLNCDNVVETLCRARVSPVIIERLINAHQTHFSEQNIDWQKAARELTMCCLIRVDSNFFVVNEENWRKAFFKEWLDVLEVISATQETQELAQSLQDIQQRFFTNQNDTTWQVLCEELTGQAIKGLVAA